MNSATFYLITLFTLEMKVYVSLICLFLFTINCSANHTGRPMEMDGFFQGDIAHIPKSKYLIKRPSSFWSGGIVPFEIHHHRGRSRKLILQAMKQIESVSCIRFVPRDAKKHPDFVEIVKKKGCWSYVGRLGGRQEVSIGRGCENKGIIMHELIHALGFGHMHDNPNRDQYIRINWNNIRPGEKHNFVLLNSRNYETAIFDFSSIMLYDEKAFSRNNLPTIQHKLGPHHKVVLNGSYKKNSPSRNDIYYLNKAYKCKNRYSKPLATLDTIVSK